MKLASLATLGLGLLGVALFYSAVFHSAVGASPVLIKRGIIPGLASDSAPGATLPKATSTPGPPLGLELVVRIDMVANELAYTAGAPNVPVTFRSKIEGPVPSGSTLKYLSGAIVEAHPSDECTWEPQFTKTALDMTASLRTSLFPPKQEATISFDGPIWHFNVFCRGVMIRVPASGDESLANWLGLIFRSPTAVTVELANYSGGPECVFNRGVATASDLWGTVTITVDIVRPPCALPTPTAPGP